MHHILLIGIGGACGAICRYGIYVSAQRRWPDMPYGTLIANVAGCLLIGLVAQLCLQNERVPESVRPLLVTGFLGAFTTFSTFGYESLQLTRSSPAAGLAYAVGSLLLGLIAVWFGMRLAALIW